MISSMPGLVLFLALCLAVLLLPRLGDEPARHEEPRRPTEELHIKPRRE